MTVRETLDFSRRCLGSGARYDMLSELARRERNAGIKPDPEIDALMKATVVEGKQNNIVTDLVLKALGLDICADIAIGGPMIRGISGGQKKRVTTGEMLTGPATALFMDEISTGLDSSSTFLIVKYIRQVAHVMNATVMMSLLQPPPETYALFDDIILISEGYIVYHGPRENILEFFESAGFRCPERKGVADFLQEVTSRKDQQQYWFHEQDHYRYVSVQEFAQHFKIFHVGQKLQKELQVPYDKSKTHPAALTTKKYGLSSPIGGSNTVVSDDDAKSELDTESTNQEQMSEVTSGTNGTENRRSQKGMVLPFQPLSLSFNHINYYVDMPAEMKAQGFTESRLQLLSDISGAFRPGVLTALVGVSGAGKTTLMDVLAGRKTSGTIEGDIKLSGYPKKQETFARISGYCEQTDIHSPNLTVYESLVFSAWLRLSSEVDENTRKVFVEEVMSLVELDVLRDALVGLPGVSGLSTEQRKRLTIAVELVANPSIIFMDEPTSGLDARAAAIVMRTVRNTVNTGRTVVCTIHQPSIDIFESFDELLLLKRGGRIIYAGQLGPHSHILVDYFEAIPGVPKITEGYNPATWMLEVSSTLAEARLNIDFAEVYASSALYRSNQELIKQLSVPPPGLQDLSFPTKYSQNFLNQCVANTWKQFRSYWKDPPYNAMRYLMTLLYGLVFGTVFWRKGKNVESVNDLYSLLGATYAAVFFLGAANLLTLLPVVSIERTVFYREKAAGMYSPLSYAFGQGFVEFCYSAVQGVLYTVLIYSMVGYEWKVDKFFYFVFFMVGAFAYFTLFSMMLIACTPSEMLASVLVSFVLSFWNNFAGFIITRPLIPVWWRWFYWANPVSWTIYGVIASQFADSEHIVKVPGQSTTMVVKDYLKDNMGYKHDFLGYVVLAHFGYVIFFFFLFGYGIKYLNFQKR
ncbi:hypothetical protein E2562_003919 [Oryza meyeriana var. granulata]|uniref:ABC transporter domain-containing protein n=1 Tax=Oryza meyeriana var. granulata TaxID=110450 RepID=A0A6G1CYX6_9ORYZ|nr:hypothetical protein E2562_003919 [Oryza meyeriana var. granulata]